MSISPPLTDADKAALQESLLNVIENCRAMLETLGLTIIISFPKVPE